MTQAELLPEIFKLDPRVQFRIAEAIQNHLRDTVVNEDEFKRELDRRRDDFLKNPNDEISWEDLSKELDQA